MDQAMTWVFLNLTYQFVGLPVSLWSLYHQAADVDPRPVTLAADRAICLVDKIDFTKNPGSVVVQGVDPAVWKNVAEFIASYAFRRRLPDGTYRYYRVVFETIRIADPWEKRHVSCVFALPRREDAAAIGRGMYQNGWAQAGQPKFILRDRTAAELAADAEALRRGQISGRVLPTGALR